MDDTAKRGCLVFLSWVFDWVNGPLSWAEMGMAGRGGQLGWVLGEPSTYYVMSMVEPRASSDNVPQST